MGFQLNIISLKGQLFSGVVDRVTIPAETGTMTVLSDHMSIVSPLKMGEVEVKGEDEIHMIIGKGIFTMNSNRAELLVEDATKAQDISEQEVKQTQREAQKILESEKIDEKTRLQAEYALKKSIFELKLLKKE